MRQKKINFKWKGLKWAMKIISGYETEIVNGSELPNKIFAWSLFVIRAILYVISPNDLHKFQNDAKNYQELLDTHHRI